MSSLIEQQVNLANKQYEYQVVNDRIGRGARREDYVRVKKPFNRVNQDTIDEYNQQFNQPKEFRNEQGELIEPPAGERFKYNQVSNIPELEEFEPPVEVLTEDDFVDIENEKVATAVKIKDLQKELVDADKYIERIRDEVNNGTIKSRVFNRRLGEANRAKELFKEQIIDAEDNLTHYHNMIQENEGNKAIYQAELQRVKTDNQAKIKSYQEQLNVLNRGAFQMSKSSNETEEEYLERLKDSAEVEEPDEILHDAEEFAIRNFKNKMKELIRDDVLIEQVANSLSIDTKVKILKTFPRFKKKYLELYGFDNKQVLINDILGFARDYTEEPTSKPDMDINRMLQSEELDLESFLPPSHIITGIKLTPQPEDNRLEVENTTNNRVVYFRPAVWESKKVLLYSFSGDVGSYEDYRNRRINNPSASVITQQTGITKKQIELALESGNTVHMVETLFTKYKIPFSTPNNSDLTIFEEEYVKQLPKKVGKPRLILHTDVERYGMGLPENIPEYVNFGKALLMANKLYYKNILALKHHTKREIQGFKNVKVSEKFVEIIMKMLKGGKATGREIKDLPPQEQILYDKLIMFAGLHKNVEHDKDRTVGELKKRLRLIEGEIEVGNDNPELIKELYHIIYALKEFREITATEASDYMKQYR